VTDEDGVQVILRSEETFEKAQNPQQAERLKQQLLKCGDSDFECVHAFIFIRIFRTDFTLSKRILKR